MSRPRLCDYSDACIIFKGTATNAAAAEQTANNADKKVIFKNCTPFTSCISKIIHTQIDNTHLLLW